MQPEPTVAPEQPVVEIDIEAQPSPGDAFLEEYVSQLDLADSEKLFEEVRTNSNSILATKVSQFLLAKYQAQEEVQEPSRNEDKPDNPLAKKLAEFLIAKYQNAERMQSSAQSEDTKQLLVVPK